MKLIYDKSGSKIGESLHRQVYMPVYNGIYPGAMATLYLNNGELYSLNDDPRISRQVSGLVLNRFNGVLDETDI
jgi:hypothetical protein